MIRGMSETRRSEKEGRGSSVEVVSFPSLPRSRLSHLRERPLREEGYLGISSSSNLSFEGQRGVRFLVQEGHEEKEKEERASSNQTHPLLPSRTSRPLPTHPHLLSLLVSYPEADLFSRFIVHFSFSRSESSSTNKQNNCSPSSTSTKPNAAR